MNWLRQKIRKWLGLGEMFMGVDVGMKDNSCIIICSRLGGGRIKIIDVHYSDRFELEKEIKYLQAKYDIAKSQIIADMPYGERFGSGFCM
ncbi:MAG: hypothetical protein PHF37_05740 [Phycisphaerae bacterium]|nr:hypothetical protein [Phycisphaerae bacterium]